jgi:ribokinase
MISVASGANEALTAADVTAAFESLGPGEEDVVLVGHEIPTLTAKHALRLGRTVGATTVFNPAPAGGVDRAVFGLADILTANRLELATIIAVEEVRVGRARGAEGRPTEAARTLLRKSAEGNGVARAVVVTLGAAGAVVVTADGETTDLPARSVGSVDAVGAGDTFAGVLAASLAAGQDIVGAASRAVAAATVSTQRTGAREGSPTVDELAAFLNR